jgi:diacylglycerol O-acyltransferase
VLGPKVPLYAAGARMASYWPLSIVEHGVGINITVMSYAGAMGFGFTVARNAVPEASELSECLADAHKELLGLLARAKKATPRRKIASRKK